MTARPGSVHEFCWMDLKTRDPAGAAAFFAAALGWHFAVDERDWRRAVKITAGGHPIGGVSDLANPVYPPGTPPHTAFYLATDDVDRRTEVATAHGARLVVGPFDAGDQGRAATLVDPVGAAFTLWQPNRFAGWAFPPGVAGTPLRVVLACAEPDRARDFYRELTGTPFARADFTAAPGATPGWELVVGVDDPDGVAALGHVTRFEEDGRPGWRLTSPEGLTFRLGSSAG